MSLRTGQVGEGSQPRVPGTSRGEVTETPPDKAVETEAKWKGHFRAVGHFVSIVGSGFAVGWILEIATSSSIATATTGILALIATAVGALSHIQTSGQPETSAAKEKPRINPAPIAWVVIGLGVGTYFGIKENVSGGLDPSPASIYAAFKGSNLQEQAIYKRVLSKKYPFVSGDDRVDDVYSVTADEAKGIRDAGPDDGKLRAALRAVKSNALVRSLPDLIQDQKSLRKAVDKIALPPK
jgi:hypothetical protein